MKNATKMKKMANKVLQTTKTSNWQRMSGFDIPKKSRYTLSDIMPLIVSMKKSVGPGMVQVATYRVSTLMRNSDYLMALPECAEFWARPEAAALVYGNTLTMRDDLFEQFDGLVSRYLMG